MGIDRTSSVPDADSDTSIVDVLAREISESYGWEKEFD